MKQISERVNNLSYEIIGAAMAVHRVLRAGLLEQIYEDALCIELEDRKISFKRQKPVGIYHKDRAIGDMRLDLLVDDLGVVEFKSVEKIAPIHTAQTLTYLKITEKTLALLINFNTPILKQGIKRVAL